MRILIVEDEVRLAEALTQILLQHKYTADAVHDGESGLDYALSGVYDLIILDIMLPRRDGISVLRALRAQGVQTPVLLLTAKDEIADKVAGLDSGADDYLTKPFATEELLARVRAMVRRRGEIESDALGFGDITLDLKTSQLACGSKGMRLALKEFQIMEMLLRGGKQILTKEQFIEKIWGCLGDAEYNNVEVYVSFLRKKLVHIGSRVEVRTARGIGYFLEMIEGEA